MVLHDVGTQVGSNRIVAKGLVVHHHELVVDFILLTGNLHIARLLLRTYGITLVLLVDEEVEVGLVLSLQHGKNLIRNTYVTIDTVTRVVLIVLVAAPIGVVTVLGHRIIP